MFTGSFKKISRSEAKTLAENFGGKVLGSVSKKLNILVVIRSKPTKKKIDKAKELNIKIYSENEVQTVKYLNKIFLIRLIHFYSCISLIFYKLFDDIY